MKPVIGLLILSTVTALGTEVALPAFSRVAKVKVHETVVGRCFEKTKYCVRQVSSAYNPDLRGYLGIYFDAYRVREDVRVFYVNPITGEQEEAGYTRTLSQLDRMETDSPWREEDRAMAEISRKANKAIRARNLMACPDMAPQPDPCNDDKDEKKDE